MNGKVRALAYLYIACCSAVLAIGLFLCVGLAVSRDPRSGNALATIGMPFMMLSVVYFIPGVVGGLGLLRGKAWARTVMIALSVLVLLLIPVGTALGIYGLWVLRGGAWPTREVVPAPVAPVTPVPRLAPRSPEQRSRYGGLLLAAGGVACAFIIAIGTGFRLTHQPAPFPIDRLYYVAILGMVGVLVTAGVKIMRSGFRIDSAPVTHWSGANRKRRALARREREQREMERSRRLAELAADPVRRKYAERIERGEWWWSDEQIAYDLDPNRVVTCPHLQQIERGMRSAGIAIRLQRDTTIQADCCVDPAKLAERFALALAVHYREPAAYDRSLEDPPAALIACDACQSVIDVVQRRRARTDTPWFPA